MKYAIIFILAICSLPSGAQTRQDDGAILSMRIAERIGDTLLLGIPQVDSLYRCNLAIHGAKMDARGKGLDAESLRRALQRIENTRDSLYMRVLTPPQFEMYIRKKAQLIRAR